MKDVIKGVRNTVKYWWISLVIGLLAIILGVWSLVTPVDALYALTTVFIIAFFVSGLIEIIFAISNRHLMKGWGWTLSGGIIDILLGVMLVALPTPMVTVALIYFVGFWIMLRSIWAIGAASELQSLGVRGWGWMLALAILALIFSIIFIFSSPIFGGGFVVAFFAVSMLIYGVFRIYLAVQFKSIKNDIEDIKKKLS